MSRFAAPASMPPYQLSPDEQAAATAYKMAHHSNLSCCTHIYMGFFFDGTGNNLERDKPLHKQTNVARLYDVYDTAPDLKSPVKGTNRFKTYIAGVGTPFSKEVGDTGAGLQQTCGLASGWGGESRIAWALLKLQNNLHAYYFGQTLSEAMGYGENEVPLLMKMCQDQHVSVSRMNRDAYNDSAAFVSPPSSTMDVLAVSYDVAGMHNYDGARRQYLRERNIFLKKKLQPLLSRKPTVESVRVSVFGFSRGAAEARVFLNWMREACDDEGLRLGGIPLAVDFLGVFDTVASVGYSEAIAEGVVEGHGGWARESDLVVPGFVQKCLHLVAAHEVRGSFPLDALVGQGEEYVYPGVHSDVGGGYAPNEQGRSPEDSAKLSQIPLGHMYRAAVAAGVPLDLEGETVPSLARTAFITSSTLVTAFNRYVQATEAISRGSTVDVMHAHYGKYVSWRRLRLDSYAKLPATLRASASDRDDLVASNEELKQEAEQLESDDTKLSDNEKFYENNPMASDAMPPHIMAFFRGLFEYDKLPDWERVRPYWNHPLDPTKDQALIEVFDNYVHDSRAGFRPLAPDDDDWRREQLQRMKRLARQDAEVKANAGLSIWALAASGEYEMPATPPLTQKEEAELERYRQTGALPAKPGGWEYSLTWGYLRWRVVFPR